MFTSFDCCFDSGTVVPDPCHFLSVQLPVLGNPPRNEGNNVNAIFFYSRLVSQSREEELFPFTEMVAESGGYIGVILGFSVLDFSLFLEGALGTFEGWVRAKAGA